jgi:arylsulfatase A-like enzyme
VLPTVAAIAGVELDDEARGRDLTPILADAAGPERERLARTDVDLGSVSEHPAPAPSVQDEVHFTFDDHQAATALQNVAGQPNRVRAVRTADGQKLAVYFDPAGDEPPQYEMYDLGRDPDEGANLVDRSTGEPRAASDAALRSELGERLAALMAANGTAAPPQAGVGSALSRSR